MKKCQNSNFEQNLVEKELGLDRFENKCKRWSDCTWTPCRRKWNKNIIVGCLRIETP